MAKESKQRVRAALMMSAAMLLAPAAIAQTAPVATPQVTPPPVATTAPTPSVTPPPIARTAPPSGDSATRVNPEAAAQAAAEDAERRTVNRAVRRAAPRAAERSERAAPARVAAAPVAPAVAATVPQATPAGATAQPAAAAPAEQRAAEAPVAASQQTSTTTEQGPALWPLALIALLIVGAGAAWFLMRRRRSAEEYAAYVEEPTYVEPAPVAHEPVAADRSVAASAPVAAAAAAGLMIDDRQTVPAARVSPAVDADTMPEQVIVSDAAPVTAEDATVVAANDADVAALTAADAPGDRPWLEFAMRPVRAGANVDEALVEIELTIANAGNLPAEDVRISTFMLPAGNDSEMERLLIERRDEAVSPITIAAGEGTRVDATLATSRAALVNGAESAAFQPVIVADARYRLPDGSEGRTFASFLVGGTPAEGTTLEPLSLDRPVVRDDVEAQLYREPARV